MVRLDGGGVILEIFTVGGVKKFFVHIFPFYEILVNFLQFL